MQNGHINRAIYCSKTCQHKSMRIEITCKTCGKIIPRKIDGKRKRSETYCSRECYFADKDYSHSDETKRKLRIAQINYLKRTSGILPMYNLKACKFFEKFDKNNNTNGQFATNGGEYYFSTLGYWVDYINHQKKIIIEWNERKHYKYGKLRQRDVRREKEILNILPDFVFIQLKYDDYVTQSLLLETDYCIRDPKVISTN
jgi:hypothetical protein